MNIEASPWTRVIGLPGSNQRSASGRRSRVARLGAVGPAMRSKIAPPIDRRTPATTSSTGDPVMGPVCLPPLPAALSGADRGHMRRDGAPNARQPPERAITSSSSGTARSCSRASRSSRKPSGRATLIGPLVWPRRIRSPPGDDRQRRVERGDEVVELGERRHLGEAAADLAADRVAGEVPRGVLAERRACAHALVAVVGDERPGVVDHHAGGDAERARRRRRAAGEDLEQVAEQPRPAEAAAPDDDAVAAGRAPSSRRRRRPPRCRRCRAPGST